MTRVPRMRPEFSLGVPGDGDAVMSMLRDRLAEPDSPLLGQVRGRFAFVRFPEEQRSLLSPHLNLELRKAEHGTVLHGRFSPRPNVWTGFMALFFFLGMVGLGGLVFGLAQWNLDGPTWPMLLAPASIALIGFIYGAAFIGQGLSTEEMYALRAFVEGTIRDAERGHGPGRLDSRQGRGVSGHGHS